MKLLQQLPLRHPSLGQERLEDVLLSAEASSHHIHVVTEVSEQMENPLLGCLARSALGELFIGYAHP